LQSGRAKNPFIPVNCGVLSGLMFEDKLFGHEKGAFTGAVSEKQGCFEMAHTGTLFLDEISELRLENQVDFLRILEDLKFTRIGGDQMIEVDLRIIAATNKNLKKVIETGQFREDLYYRLHVIPVRIPPLRERKQVIPKMVDHFMNQFEMVYKKPKPTVHPGVIDLFFRYDWPGNVRELKNLMERVFIINTSDTIYADHFPPDFLQSFETIPDIVTLAEVRKTAEKKAIIEALLRTDGDREKASNLLDISPRTLRHKLKAYGLKITGTHGANDRPVIFSETSEQNGTANPSGGSAGVSLEYKK
jgi:transcriptional regulator with PAS, ATPase and Fis domain